MSALPAPDDSTARSRCRAVSDAARTRLALVTRSDGGSRRISRGAVALGPRERAHSCRGRCVASDLYASDSYASDLRASHLQRQICMGCALFFFVPSSSSLLLRLFFFVSTICRLSLLLRLLFVSPSSLLLRLLFVSSSSSPLRLLSVSSSSCSSSFVLLRPTAGPFRCAAHQPRVAPRCPCNCMWLQAATIAETSAPSVWGAVC